MICFVKNLASCNSVKASKNFSVNAVDFMILIFMILWSDKVPGNSNEQQVKIQATYVTMKKPHFL